MGGELDGCDYVIDNIVFVHVPRLNVPTLCWQHWESWTPWGRTAEELFLWPLLFAHAQMRSAAE